MPKGNSGEGLVPYEALLMVHLHERINHPVNLLPEQDRVITSVTMSLFRRDSVM
jgi:hypothetical protein